MGISGLHRRDPPGRGIAGLHRRRSPRDGGVRTGPMPSPRPPGGPTSRRTSNGLTSPCPLDSHPGPFPFLGWSGRADLIIREPAPKRQSASSRHSGNDVEPRPLARPRGSATTRGPDRREAESSGVGADVEGFAARVVARVEHQVAGDDSRRVGAVRASGRPECGSPGSGRTRRGYGWRPRGRPTAGGRRAGRSGRGECPMPATNRPTS